MGRRDDLVELLGDFVRRIGESGDPWLARAPAVTAIVNDLIANLDEEDSADIQARNLVGWTLWYRAETLPADQRQSSLDAALEVMDEAAVAIGVLSFPEPLLPALADRAVPRLSALLQYAVTSPDVNLLSGTVDQWIHVVNATPEGHPDRATRLSVLCGALCSRYQRTSAVADLDNALLAGRRAADLAAGGQSSGFCLSNFSAALKLRYDRTDDPVHLDEAIAAARRAVGVTREQYDLSAALTNLSGMLSARFQLGARPEDAADAAAAAREAVAMASLNDPSRAGMLTNLTKALHDSYTVTGSVSELDGALEAGRLAARAMEGLPEADKPLSNLADVLESRLKLTNSPADLDEAVDVLRRLIRATPLTQGETRASRLLRLASSLSSRFSDTGVTADLDELISASAQAVEADPGSSTLAVLSTSLLMRYKETENATDLDDAITHAHRTLDFAAGNAPDSRLRYMRQLDSAIWKRFRRSGEPGDLDEVILLRQAIAAMPEGDAQRCEHLANLGHALLTRFLTRQESEDLDEAVDTLRGAAAIAGDDTERMYCLSDLASALSIRYTHLHVAADLSEAVETARHAATALQGNPPPGVLLNLARLLGAPTVRSLDNLDAAIGLLRRAAAATAAGHALPSRERGYLTAQSSAKPESDQEPTHAEVQGILVGYLSQRFEWTNVLSDADTSVLTRRELAEASDSAAEQARALAGLGFALRLRFNRSRQRSDLDESLASYQRAVGLEPGNVDYLSHLSESMSVRFLFDHDDADLEEAVQFGRRAAQLALDSGRRDPLASSSLCMVLLNRFQRYSEQADIDEAVDAARQAAEFSESALDRVKSLLVLADALMARVRHDPGKTGDRAEGLRVLSEVVRSSDAPPWLRVFAAKNSLRLTLMDHGPDAEDFTFAADLLETAVHLFPEVAPRRMRRDEQRTTMKSVAGLADDAAAFALADPSRGPAERARRALSVLEMGRAVLLAQMLDARSDLTELRRHHPELAAQFEALRDLLDREADPSPLSRSPDATGIDRVESAAELAATLRQIRQLDGFSTFALPPTVDELLIEANQGPVVTFNVGYGGGTALILSPDGVTPVALPSATAPQIVDQVNAFHVALQEAHDQAGNRVEAQGTLSDALKWLWDHVTGPVLDELGYDGPPRDKGQWPRVWWAPGGFLGLLPLHAAGYHDDLSGGKTVMDRVVSSYTPTIRALRHARRRAAAGTADSSLIVAMPTTPGLPELRSVPAETELLARFLPGPVLLTAPTRNDVLAELPGRSIAHFACHGTYDPEDPAASRLLLSDHELCPLSVADLSEVNLEGAQLAYLSACHTAVNSSDRLLDEGIHLAGALQAAGFPQVVGTLWALDEEVAAEVTEDFYTWLRDPRTAALDLSRAAHALHRATRRQRDLYPETPSLWASHLHFGA